MEKTIEEMKQELEEKTVYAAVLTERNRIMSELDAANLPVGVWTMIKDIINPPTN